MCSRFWGAPDGQRILTALERHGITCADYSGGEARPQATAPTDTVLAVLPDSEDVRLVVIDSWGFTIPGSTRPIINGRIETVLQKSLFAESARQRRCVLPAEGFIEWKGEKGHKVPMLFYRKDGELIMMAGVWRAIVRPNRNTTEAVILTTEPNSLVAEIHNRMPVLVRDEYFKLWLRGDAREAVAACIEPFPSDMLESREVEPEKANRRYRGENQDPLFE